VQFVVVVVVVVAVVVDVVVVVVVVVVGVLVLGAFLSVGFVGVVVRWAPWRPLSLFD